LGQDFYLAFLALHVKFRPSDPNNLVWKPLARFGRRYAYWSDEEDDNGFGLFDAERDLWSPVVEKFNEWILNLEATPALQGRKVLARQTDAIENVLEEVARANDWSFTPLWERRLFDEDYDDEDEA